MRFLDIFNLSELFYKKADGGDDWKSNFQPPSSKALALIRAGFFNDEGEIVLDENKFNQNKDAIKALITKALEEDRKTFEKALSDAVTTETPTEDQKAYSKKIFYSLIESHVLGLVSQDSVDGLKRALHSMSNAMLSKIESGHWINELYQKINEIYKDLQGFDFVEQKTKSEIEANLKLLLNWVTKGFVGESLSTPINLKINSSEDNTDIKAKKIAFNQKAQQIENLIKQNAPKQAATPAGSAKKVNPAVSSTKIDIERKSITDSVEQLKTGVKGEEEINNAVASLTIDEGKKNKIKQIIKTSLTAESVACLNYLINKLETLNTKKSQTAKENLVNFSKAITNLFSLNFSSLSYLVNNLNEDMRSFEGTVLQNIRELSGEKTSAPLKDATKKLVNGINKILSLQPLTIDDALNLKAPAAGGGAKLAPTATKTTIKSERDAAAIASDKSLSVESKVAELEKLIEKLTESLSAEQDADKKQNIKEEIDFSKQIITALKRQLPKKASREARLNLFKTIAS